MNEILFERLKKSATELEERVYDIYNTYDDVTDKLLLIRETIEKINKEKATESNTMESKKMELKNTIENEREEIYLENTESEEKIKLYSYRTEVLDRIIEDLENL